MAVADVELSETNLAIATPYVTTDGITNLNFVSTDTPNTALSDAVAITANTNSYEKWVRLHLKTQATPLTTISKIIVWISAGTNPVTTGCDVYTTAEETDKAAIAYRKGRAEEGEQGLFITTDVESIQKHSETMLKLTEMMNTSWDE